MHLAMFRVNSDLLLHSYPQKKGLLSILGSWWVGCTEEKEKCKNDLGKKWKTELYFWQF